MKNFEGIRQLIVKFCRTLTWNKLTCFFLGFLLLSQEPAGFGISIEFQAQAHQRLHKSFQLGHLRWLQYSLVLRL